MSYCSFGGQPIAKLSLMIPWTGVWVADVDFAGTASIPNAGSLVMGNLSLQGGVYRQAMRWGQISARLAGGAATLSKPLAARGYSIPGGVLASIVAADVGAETGEKIVVPPAYDRSLPFWSREPGPGGATLLALFGEAWWVDGSGVIQCSPRPASSVTSPFTATAWQGGSGTLVVATEDPAAWIPGAVFANAQVTPQQTIVQVRHFFDRDGALRTKVMVQ